MAFPNKKPGLGIMIAVGKPKNGPPMPPKGMDGAPKAPEMSDEMDDSDASEDMDVSAKLDHLEAMLKKVCEAVGCDDSSDETDHPAKEDQSDDSNSY